MIENIKVKHTEYRKNNGEWFKVIETKYKVHYNQINNMIECEPYFTETGGKMSWKKANMKKYGTVPIQVEVQSPCGVVKKILSFSYDNAQLV